MIGEYLQLVLIAVILAGIAYATWRGGAANPVGTGTLKTGLASLDGDVRALKTKVGTVETRVAELGQLAATKGDIERIEGRFGEWERQLEKIPKLDDRLDAIDLDLTRLHSDADSNRRVIDAIAESLRVTNVTVQEIRTGVATTAAQTEATGKLVDRLYNFIVERGMTK